MIVPFTPTPTQQFPQAQYQPLTAPQANSNPQPNANYSTNLPRKHKSYSSPYDPPLPVQGGNTGFRPTRPPPPTSRTMELTNVISTHTEHPPLYSAGWS
jgi:hypothetical protein